MFTDQELKDLHYQMWDYIVDKLLKYKRVINISKAKLEFLESKNIDDDYISHACPMCEYNKKYISLSDSNECKYCPSALHVNNLLGCLSGLYGLCINTGIYNVQVTIALVIRDSWKEEV